MIEKKVYCRNWEEYLKSKEEKKDVAICVLDGTILAMNLGNNQNIFKLRAYNQCSNPHFKYFYYIVLCWYYSTMLDVGILGFKNNDINTLVVGILLFSVKIIDFDAQAYFCAIRYETF